MIPLVLQYVNAIFTNDVKPSLPRDKLKIANRIAEMIRQIEDPNSCFDVEEEEEITMEEDEAESEDFDWDPTSEFCQEFRLPVDVENPNKVRFGNCLVDVVEVEEAVKAFQVYDRDGKICNRGKRRPSLATMRRTFPFLSNANHLQKLRQFAKQGQVKTDECAAINFVANKLAEKAQEAFRNGYVVHDDDLREMAAAIIKENKVITSFKISDSWMNSFKRSNRISSRHITKFVSRSRYIAQDQLEKNSEQFVALARTRMANYSLDEVINVDQSGFQLELHTNRTLAPTGSKKVEVVVHSVSATTHSFTILPILTASGKLFPILYILMKENNGQFPARGHFQPTNLHIEASTSHIMGNKHMVSFCENVVFHPMMPDRLLMLADSWAPWRNKAAIDAVTPPHKQLETLIIPPGCTGIIQPLDIGLFGNYKKIVKKATRHAQRIAPGFIPHRRDNIFMTIINWSDVKEELIKVPTISDENEEKEKLPKRKNVDEIVVLCIAHSSGPSTLLAIGTNEKLIHIFEISEDRKSTKHVLSAVVPKAPTSCVFDKNDTHVIIGDRSGDVHRLSLDNGAVDELAGAISMVLDVKMTSDGKRLLMADRDEKLRAIRYPETYVIDTFFLGHTEYVRTIANTGNDEVWTAGGDSTIKRWNISSGECLKTIEHGSFAGEEKKAVRKLAIFSDNTKLVAVLEKDSTVYVIDTSSYDVAKAELNSEEVMDMTVVNDKIVVLTRSKIEILEGNGSILHTIQPSEALSGSLKATNDAVDNLFKNVTHDNQKNYEKRKTEKFAKIEEKKSLKRKAGDLE